MSSKKSSQKFSSLITFLASAVAAAVGLANIWRFSPTAAANGGGVFILVYIFCVIFVGLPIILAELGFGRAHSKGFYEAYADKGIWRFVGLFSALICFMIFSFYNIIAGRVVGYVWYLLRGSLFQCGDKEAFGAFFHTLEENLVGNLIWTGIMVLAAILINRAGVSGGIEKVAKILMPIFGVMLVGMAVYSVFLPNAWKGISFYLYPDISKFNLSGVAEALGQALMSLGIGMGAMVTYGTYVGKKENLHFSATVITLGDTLVALIAGIFIFAFMGNAGYDFNSKEEIAGEGLAFVLLPYQFSSMGWLGGMILLSFFLLLLFAAITSSVALLEVPTRYLESRFSLSRSRSILIAGGFSYLLSMLQIFSDSQWDWVPQIVPDFGSGWNFRELLQNVCIRLLAPCGTFLFSIFIARKWKINNLFAETAKKDASSIWFRRYIHFCLLWVCPILTGFSTVWSFCQCFIWG